MTDTGTEDDDEPGAEPEPEAAVPPPDALAGIVELFGALTPEELDRALAELAYRRGGEDATAEAAREAREAAVADAVAGYYLVEVAVDVDAEPGMEREGEGENEGEGERLLAPGPVAFPMLPEGAEDLPHILDVPERTVDREILAADVEERLRSDAARAVVADDPARMRRLLDVTYDLDTWGPADVADVRRRLDDALAAVEDEADADGEGEGEDEDEGE